MGLLQLCIPVADPSQVGEVRRAAARMAQTLPLSESRRADVSIVATELATNLLRHARDGRILIQAIRRDSAASLELMSIDAGPGVADMQRCLQDGFSTVGTPGNGLGAIRRLSDEFDVHSMPGKGTVVLSRIASPAAPPSPYAIGAVSLPAPGEHACGDTWQCAERERRISVMVADGLGHGPEAAVAADRAREVFDVDAFTSPAAFYQHAHRSLIGSRGAAVARAVIGPAGEIEYAGIGNIAGSVIGTDRSRGMASQNGTVGVEIRSEVSVFAHSLPLPGVMLMHSDGITSRWSFDGYPGLLMRHPAVIAGVMSRDFRRGRDDATVVVVGRARRVDIDG